MLSWRWFGSVGMAMALILGGCGGDDEPNDQSDPAPLGGAAGFPTSDCKTDIDCDDGLYCTGVEKCELFDGYKLCASGTPVECDDGIECTVDSCNEEEMACESLAPDEDGDGHADASCQAENGEALGDDCDDSDPGAFPGNEEVCDSEGRDEDCDPNTYGNRDVDADGHDDAMCCNGRGNDKVCGDDCDDFDPATKPGQVEICDEKDNNCDGEVDEGTQISGYVDEDGDQHGDPNQPIMACAVSGKFSVHGDDCDDNNIARFGTHPEICDGIDNDCDGVIDDFTLAVTWYVDDDNDGFGDAGGGTLVACEPQAGYSILPIDCDDSSAGINPGADERCDGLDNDCNGSADYVLGINDSEDDDRDGHVDARCGGIGDDCDDNNAAVYPGAPAQCDGLDNDCDGEIDDEDGEQTWYADVDGDGYGDEGATIEACQAPPGFVARAGDCDDTTAAKRPGAPDLCGGGDEDCDGEEDENALRFAFYADSDGDGAGGGDPVLACTQPEGFGLLPNDCDDSNPLRFEGNPEVCDNIDNDCDGNADNDPTLCNNEGTDGTCTAGACVIDACLGSYLNCDGDPQNGCESDTDTDLDHCGACDDACTAGDNATASCSGGTCEYTCEMGFVDCDLSAATGCEASFLDDPDNCGGCDLRCDDADNAPAVCANGQCEFICEDGWEDCDGAVGNGCEARLDDDSDNCGVCGMACPGDDLCVRGVCQSAPWVSDGSGGEFHPTSNTVLPSGVYHYTSITIPQGVTVSVDDGGALELYATGDIAIEGLINVSGSAGALASTSGVNNCVCGGGTFGIGSNGGGDTGHPGGAGTGPTANGICAPGGGGGLGGDGTNGTVCCGTGGKKGGGAGGSCNGAGGGGGGYAGGAGGSTSLSRGGTGGSMLGLGTGGLGRFGLPGLGGETGLAIYGGVDGTDFGGGGGSIGLAASLDLAVAQYFIMGSAGGGGGGYRAAGDAGLGGGGGGGGGALRIVTPGSLSIGQNGGILANGGTGGRSLWATVGAGGGGSGGVIYIVARDLFVQGVIRARGGTVSSVNGGGQGGLGRIRFSVLPDRCDISQAIDINPPLNDGCNVTTPGVPGFTYIDTYPF